MKKNYSVYYSVSNDELDNFYNGENIDFKIDVIDFLRHIDKNDESYEKMKQCYKIKTLTQKQIERLNFIQYLHFLSKKDDYNAKKVKRELKKGSIYNDDFLFDFCEVDTFEEHIKLFDDNITSGKIIKSIYKNKFHKSNMEYLYMENLNREANVFNDKYLEKKIKKHMIRILKKEKLTILEFLYIWQIIILVKAHFVALKFMRDELFLDAMLVEKALNKFIVFKNNYSNVFSKKQIIDFNETIVSIYRLLGSRINISEDDFKENQKKCVKFIDSNASLLNRNTVFLKTIFNGGKISKDKVISEIKDILNNKSSGEVMYLAFLGTSELKPEQYTSYIQELENIQYDKSKIEEINLQSLNFAIEIIKFWSGGKFNLTFLKSNMYLDPFLRLCFEYDNQNINYNQFLDRLNGINYIPVSIILDWNRLEKMFEKTNSYEWFKKIVSKMDYDELKYFRLKSYLINFYSKIIHKDNVLLLSNFSEMDSFIRTIFDDIIYLYYSIIIHINVYRNFDKSVKESIITIIQDFNILEKTLTDKQYLIEFVYLLVSLSIESEDKDLKESLLELIINNDILKDNNILIFGLTYDNDKVLLKHYDSIFDSILNYYNDIKNVNKNDYMLISQITYNSLTNRVNINEIPKNHYFSKNGKNYILKNDYDDNLKDLYTDLKIEKIEETSDDMVEYNLLDLLTHRIFFANVEKMKAGKVIKTSKDVTGEELLKEMEKAIGYDKTRKDLELIRSGKSLSSVWFNIYTMHNYFKDVEQANTKMFNNSRNELIRVDNALLHFSSLILAVKLGLKDIILSDDRMFITSSVYEDLMYQKTFEISELTDGIIEPRINYDDLFDNVCILVSEMNDKSRVISITKANIMGTKHIDYINKYDQDLFKFFVNTNDSNRYFLITEDPFYYKVDGFKERSFSLYSYVVEKFIQNDIDSVRLLEITEKLYFCNYNFNVSKSLFNFLLEKSDDDNIRKIIEKIKTSVI